MIGTREPHIYGSVTFDQLKSKLKNLATELKIDLEIYQSNHEGYLIDKIQEAAPAVDGILINAGAYTHTSIAIADALTAADKPVVEVHMSNIYQREKFRHHSYISAIAKAVIVGLGVDSYLYGLKAIDQLVNSSQTTPVRAK